MTWREIQAVERRRERAEQKRHRELQRLAKEQAKLSAMEQARLEVDAYQNRLAVILSVHKEQENPWNWNEISALLAPLPPARSSHEEFKTRCSLIIDPQGDSQNRIEQARIRDEEIFNDALQAYAEEKKEWENLKSLAHDVLAGNYGAYTKAISTLDPFSEIAELGSALHFTVHGADLLECRVKVNGVQAIPSEIKALTATGKLSIRPMPKAQFHELYQDHLSSCILRVGREVFAILPVEQCLITALADWLDPSTGQTSERPVLSVLLSRAAMASLDFERLDPSNAIDNFFHRGDFKASRKSGAFAPITPLTPSDIPKPNGPTLDYDDLIESARRLHQHIAAELARFDVGSALASPEARSR